MLYGFKQMIVVSFIYEGCDCGKNVLKIGKSGFDEIARILFGRNL